MTCYNYDFIPYNRFEKNPVIEDERFLDSYNSFKNYVAEPLSIEEVSEKQVLLRPIMEHIRDVWGDGDDQSFKWILAWISNLIKHPRKHLPSLTLIGDEGTGKTCLVDFLKNHVLGIHTYFQIPNLDDLSHHFNAFLEGKTLIYVAELWGTSTSENTMSKIMDQIKDKITDETIRVTKKGVDSYIVRNYCHFIMTSNHEKCLSITDKNRRHQMFKVSDSKKGDRDYFKHLYESFTGEMGSLFYSFLFHLNLDDYPNPNDIMTNQIMTNAISLSLPSPERFVTEVKNGDYKFIGIIEETRIGKFCKCQNYVTTEGETEIVCPHSHKIYKDTFYKNYVSWCKENGYKPFSKVHFYASVGKMLKEAPRTPSAAPRAWEIPSAAFTSNTISGDSSPFLYKF